MLLLVACSDDEAPATKPDEPEAAVEVLDEPEHADTTFDPGATDGPVLVQDLWIHERVVALRPGRDPVDLGPDILAALDPLIERSVDLDDGLVFHVVDALVPGLEGPRERARDDVEVVAGLLEHDGDRALAVLATPHLDAGGNVGFGDEVVLDLTVLGEDLLAPGDVVVIDHAFVQAYPPGADGSDADPAALAAETDADDALAMLALRLAEERVQYLGAVDEDTGEVTVGLYTGHLGVAVEG